jgi:phosphate starvation-inducible PhoH-like protein
MNPRPPVRGPISPVPDDQAHIVVTFDDNRLMPALFGEFDRNLAQIEQSLGVDAAARGNQVSIRGSQEACTRARLALDILYGRLQEGHELSPGDVDGAVRLAEAAEAQLSLPTLEPRGKLAMAQISTRRRTVMARTGAGRLYPRFRPLRPLSSASARPAPARPTSPSPMPSACSSAAPPTGIILSRPAVEAGERLGFLPGDMKEKVDPYLRPLYDALYDMMPPTRSSAASQSGIIEVAPLAFMRGRTLPTPSSSSTRRRTPRRCR